LVTGKQIIFDGKGSALSVLIAVEVFWAEPDLEARAVLAFAGSFSCYT